MPVNRMQVYLTDAQRERIDELAVAEGVTRAALIRRALDCYLPELPGDPTVALSTNFGAAPNASVHPRDEWDRG